YLPDEFVQEIHLSSQPREQAWNVTIDGKEERARNVQRRAIGARTAMASRIPETEAPEAWKQNWTDRALGIGIFEKRESPQGYADAKKHILYLPPGAAVDEPVNWQIEEAVNGGVRVVATAQTKYAEKIQMPEFSDVQAPMSPASKFRVRATYSMS